MSILTEIFCKRQNQQKPWQWTHKAKTKYAEPNKHSGKKPISGRCELKKMKNNLPESEIEHSQDLQAS